MYRHLYLVFGTTDEHETWLIGIGDEPVPAVGETVRLALPHPDGTSISMTADIRYRTWIPGEPLRVYAHGGAVLPPTSVSALLQARGCLRLSDEESAHIVSTILNVPTTANTHEILLIIGNESTYEAWRWIGPMHDTVIPVFGQRVHLPLTQIQATRWSDVLDTSGDSRGEMIFPGIVFYSAKSDLGDAQVAIWLPEGEKSSLVSGFDLVASGWEKLAAEDFTAEDFDTWERIALAERTILFAIETDDGRRGIDFEVMKPGTITAEQLLLLPIAIRNYCLMFQHSNGVSPDIG